MITRIEVYPEHYPALKPRRRWDYQIVQHNGSVLACDRVMCETAQGAEAAAGLYAQRYRIKPQVMESL